MPEELDIMLHVCRQLAAAEFKYMLTGSMAANYYTTPRMTRDIDIVLDLPLPKLDEFVSLFDKEYYIDRDMIAGELPRNGMFNIIHNEYIFKVDFILLKPDIYNRSAFDRRKSIDISGTKVEIIRPEDLAVSKMLWAKESLSEIQIKDVANILTSTPDIDMEYVNRWVLKLELEEVFTRVQRQ